MDSEIEQLKNEIEEMKNENEQLKNEIGQLEKENEKLRNRYVPDEKNTQSTFVVEIEEDSNNYIVKTKCLYDGICHKRDVEGKIYYVKFLPCADVFNRYTIERFYDLINKYDGCIYPKCHKYIIPKSSCDHEELTKDIEDIIEDTRSELNWHSDDDWPICDSDDSDDESDDSDKNVLAYDEDEEDEEYADICWLD